MTGLSGDLRYSLRMLLKHPGTSGLAVFALALGIGLTAVMFSIIYVALWRGLPYDEPHEILHVEEHNLAAGITDMAATLHDFLDWEAAERSFEEFGAYYDGTVNVAGEERAERFEGAFISASAMRIPGIEPLRGRLFLDEETQPGAPGTIILSYAVWRDRFGFDESVLERTLNVNAEPATVVGIMPEGFAYPFAQEVWMPLRMDPAVIPRGGGTQLEVVGRLRDDVTPDQAFEDLSAIAARGAIEFPETNAGVGVIVQPFVHEYVGDEPRAMLMTMLVAVFLVLLIACANVANLLLARTQSRATEVAVRSAIGASRGRIVGQLLIESVALAVAGGILGTAIAYWGIVAFRNAIVVAAPPAWMEFALHPQILLFIVFLTLISGVLAGGMPALKATGADINAILKDESRGSSSLKMGRISRGLVVAEIALSVGLLVSAGLMTKSVVKLGTADFGFDTEGILTGRVGLFPASYPEVEDRRRYFEELELGLAALPGAESASLGTTLPGLGACCWRFTPEGSVYQRDQDHPVAARVVASPGYIETFGIDLIEGRGIEASDGPGTLPVVVVNQLFEREFFPDGALGKRIRQGGLESQAPWMTVVGVVSDAHMGGIDTDVRERSGFYLPLAQSDERFLSLGVRARGDADPLLMVSAVRDAAAAIDRDTPVYWLQDMDQALNQEIWFYNIFGGLFMIFGAAALFLASVGLYGVMAFAVSRRTQEVGIRLALGAQPRQVVRMIVEQGARQVALGVVLGLGLAFLLSRGLGLILFDVNPSDPFVYAAVVLLLGLTGILASYVPGRRASRIDPMVAFRYE